MVAGRPASFIQNLYPPYYLYRPTLPLAIAGAAEAATHDKGYSSWNYTGEDAVQVRPESMRAAAPSIMLAREAEYGAAEESYSRVRTTGSAIEPGMSTAAGAAAGDQFEFTVKHPVSLHRRLSAMLPLVESPIEARRLLIFSGANPSGRNINPRLGAELTNTTGMKLPAGPITVYDGGTYAGDALIEFWNEGEKRLISYGEDLSVTGSVTDTNTRSMVSVTVANGVMTITRSQDFLKTYTFRNTSGQIKNLVIEHPKNHNARLEAPEADEETPSAYRFTVTLQPERDLTVLVRETRPIMEHISLLQLRQDAFLSYAGNQDIPQRVRDALARAVSLRSAVSSAEAAVTAAERRREGFVSEQDRIRKNLEAAGSQSQQGQEYLRRLMSLDTSIDSITAELETLRENVQRERKAYEDYIGALSLQ
jgi:hypothetical protein